MAGHELYQIKNDYKRKIQTYLHSHSIGHHAFVQANAECHADVLPGQFRPTDDHPPCGCLRHREAASYVGHHGGADGYLSGMTAKPNCSMVGTSLMAYKMHGKCI